MISYVRRRCRCSPCTASPAELRPAHAAGGERPRGRAHRPRWAGALAPYVRLSCHQDPGCLQILPRELVRGHLVRRRARAARLRMLEDEQHLRALEDGDRPFFRTTQTRHGSPSLHHDHPRSSWQPAPAARCAQDAAEENFKIVEVDRGEAHGTPRTAASKNEMYQKVSPTPSTLTDASARMYNGRYDDFSFATAARASPCRHVARGTRPSTMMETAAQTSSAELWPTHAAGGERPHGGP
ncbi:hypothetical protein BS78_03G419800 [Paspalum vaginatum]|nr:hypothetical protein BS78_03G419800 [Paspalum vaginatum]